MVRKRKTKKRSSAKKRSRVAFNETEVGFLIWTEAPIEYELIMQAHSYEIGEGPSDTLIEHVGYASDSSLFKKPKFRKALMNYRKWGCRPRKKKALTLSSILYHAQIQ